MRRFAMKSTLGRSYPADPEDTRAIKAVLYRLGYYRPPFFGITPYPDEALFNGIERFQARHNLEKDAIMKPEDQIVEERSRGFFVPPSNDQTTLGHGSGRMGPARVIGNSTADTLRIDLPMNSEYRPIHPNF